jgi:hypothetical protein
MGKTSLLRNLPRLLPSSIVPMFVDLQGPVSAAAGHAGLLYNLTKRMARSAQEQRQMTFPSLPEEAFRDDPFTRFDEWLDETERVFGDRTGLLVLDELEELDTALARGNRFEEASVLGMLRHLIQNRSRFKLLLAASHTLSELSRWASYLINVQVIKLGYLSEAGTRQLIERPVRGQLEYDPEARQRVIALTRGHPTLVQLLCAEIITLKNEQPAALRRFVRVGDVEEAVPRALERGVFLFADIRRNQIGAAEGTFLHRLATRGEGEVIPEGQVAELVSLSAGASLDLLIRRDLLEKVEGGYCFQVELIRRWFLAADFQP